MNEIEIPNKAGMNVQNLIIEVTRRCNMYCDHCLRGDAEDIDFSEKYLWPLLSQISTVDSITFTGGEPSLVPEILRKIRFGFFIMKIPVGNFYIATNGAEVSDEFLKELMEWYLYCDDNEVTSVDISNDEFHEDQEHENIKRLQTFSFVHFKYGEQYTLSYRDMKGIIAQGRGYDIGGMKFNSAEQYELDIENKEVDDGFLYINALGKVIAGCDWSYEHQLGQEICSVEDDIWKELVDQYGEVEDGEECTVPKRA